MMRQFLRRQTEAGVTNVIDKKSRVELVLELANKLDAQDLRWDHANIILQTYGVQPWTAINTVRRQQRRSIPRPMSS